MKILADSNKGFSHFAMLVLSFFLGGCAAYDTELRNDAGEVSRCQNVGWGWLGAPIAVISQHRCESAMRERGFVPVGSSATQPTVENVTQLEKNNLIPATPSLQNSKTGASENIRLPDSWAKLSLPEATVKKGAVLWLKHQSPDIYLAVSTLPSVGGLDVLGHLRLQQQEMVAKVIKPELSPISNFEISEIRGNFTYVVGTPVNAKELVRFTTYVFQKNSTNYRLEVSQLESEYFSSRENVASVVDVILKGL